tara:strand:+ start:910 stop:1350 length:441 start_codon:yes stop_codon:yes gene_type:complete
MILTRSARDITYTPDGDLMIEGDDIKKSSMANLQLLCEVIQRRLSHKVEDWESTLVVTSNLEDFIGLEFTDFNAEIINSVIKNTLTAFRLLDPDEVKITQYVFSGTKLSFGISIRVDYNNENVNIIVSYDTRENSFQVKYLNEKSV